MHMIDVDLEIMAGDLGIIEVDLLMVLGTTDLFEVIIQDDTSEPMDQEQTQEDKQDKLNNNNINFYYKDFLFIIIKKK